MYTRRFFAPLALFIALSIRLLAQTVQPTDIVGLPDLHSYVKTPLGSIDVGTGNLHIDIPLASTPNRARAATQLRMSYDSSFYSLREDTSGTYYVPFADSHLGLPSWKLQYSDSVSILHDSGTKTYSTPTSASPPNFISCDYVVYDNWRVLDQSGTYHKFAGNVSTTPGCSTTQVTLVQPQGKDRDGGYSFDGKYHLVISNYKNAVVYDENGNQVGQTSDVVGVTLPTPEDVNGNLAWTMAPTPPDCIAANQIAPDCEDLQFPVGRTIIKIRSVKSGATYLNAQQTMSVLNAAGTFSDYVVVYRTIDIHTDFQHGAPPGLYVIGQDYQGQTQVVDSITLPNSQAYHFTYDEGSSAGHYGTISTAILPTGATVTYGFTAVSPGTPNLDPNNGYHTVDRYLRVTSVSSDASPGSTAIAYSWQPGFRAGVPVHTVTSPALDDTVYTFVCNDTNPPYVDPTFPCNIANYQGTGDKRQLLRNDAYAGADQFPGPSGSTTTLEDGSSFTTTWQWNGGSPQIYYPTYLTQEKVFDYGGALLRERDQSFLSPNPFSSSDPYLSGFITNKLRQLSLYDGSHVLQAQTTYGYDETPLTGANGVAGHDDTNAGTARRVRGNLTSVTRMIDSSTSTTSYNFYDTLGNLISTRDGKNNATTQGFDDSWYLPNCTNISTHIFATTTSNALGQSSKMTYWCDGSLAQTQDPNDLASGRSGTRTDYDLIGNVKTTIFADGGSRVTDHHNYSNPMHVTTTVASSGQALSSETYGDALGRTIEQISPDGARVDSAYNASGLLAYITNPHGSASSSADGFTAYTYDAFGRKRLQCQQDNGTSASACSPGASYLSWTYSGAQTTKRDESGQTSTQAVDALGRLVQVSESDNARTTYSYDAEGNLKCADQWGTSSVGIPCTSVLRRSFSYDGLSRLLTATNPETGTICYGIGSPCTGGYDLNGNLIAKTDAKGQPIYYDYDALNRLTYKHYGSPSAYPAAAYGYDGNAANGAPLGQNGVPTSNAVGRLSYASNYVNADQTFGYDAMGRTNFQTYCLPDNCGNRQTASAAYDIAGNLTDLFYPDGRHVTQGFDAAGRLNTVGNGTATQAYLQSTTYNPDGSPNILKLGNGVQQMTAENNRLQVQSMQISSQLAPYNGAVLLDHTYCYVNCATGGSANNGNIWGISDNLNGGKTQGFTYDNLNRISSFSLGGVANQQYQIDSFGNLTGMLSGQPVSTFDPATNRVRNLPCQSAGLPYDAAGNQLCDSDPNGAVRHYVFDTENHISQIAIAGNESSPFASYTYGADGDRVRKTNSDGTFTEYVNFNGQTIAEKDQTGAWTDYIYANGQKIAKVDPTDAPIHLSGDNCANCGGTASLVLLRSGAGHVIQSGDTLSFTQYNVGSAVGGVILIFTDASATTPVTYDTQGRSLHCDGNAPDTLQLRSVDLSPFAQKTLLESLVINDVCSPPGHFDMFFNDIAIASPDGTITTIYSPKLGTTFTAQAGAWPGAVANRRAVAEANTSDTSGASASNGTHFYLADHLGSAQMEFGSNGWPIWQGQFAPFGQELDTAYTANHYKFTGKERDSESGLDYFGARYYGSSMGRFMSPDYSSVDDGPPDAIPFGSISNPQSMNGYAYVGNNPLGGIDSDGHDCVVQTRLDYNQESVTASAGTCAKVKVGSGQKATYVPGTVKGISANGGDSIDIGYDSYDGQSSGVTNVGGAPAFDYPGIDGAANAAIFGQIGNGVMGAIKVFTVGSVVGAACVVGCPVAGTAALAGIRALIPAAAPLTLQAGSKISNFMARNPQFKGNPAGLLEAAKDIVAEAVQAKQFAQTSYGTIYRVQQTFLVVKDNVVTSWVPNAEAGKGIVTSYYSNGGK